MKQQGTKEKTKSTQTEYNILDCFFCGKNDRTPSLRVNGRQTYMCQPCYDKHVAHSGCQLCHGTGWILTLAKGQSSKFYGRCARCNPVKKSQKNSA